MNNLCYILDMSVEGGPIKLCREWKGMLKRSIQIGMSESGGRLTQKQVDAAREMARSDEEFHNGGPAPGIGEIADLDDIITGRV